MNLAFVLLPVNHLTDDLCLIANKQQHQPSYKVMQNISPATNKKKKSFPTSSKYDTDHLLLFSPSAYFVCGNFSYGNFIDWEILGTSKTKNNTKNKKYQV